jgi:hypothetical protein
LSLLQSLCPSYAQRSLADVCRVQHPPHPPPIFSRVCSILRIQTVSLTPHTSIWVVYLQKSQSPHFMLLLVHLADSVLPSTIHTSTFVLAVLHTRPSRTLASYFALFSHKYRSSGQGCILPQLLRNGGIHSGAAAS